MEADNGLLVHMETDSESLASKSVIFPQVNGEFIPFKGQEFQTLDEVYEFYNIYAKEAGFSVRSHSSKKSKDGSEVKRKEYVCSKEGSWSTEISNTVKKRRGVGRESCKARLIVVKSKSANYVVTIFEEAHSHPMTTPRRRHLLRSHRKFTGVQQLISEQLSAVNISTHQQYDLLALQSGGLENVGCTQQDMYNSNRDRRMEIKGHDGQMLYNNLLFEQEKNPGFIFKIETNSEKKITRCFWADATSRQSYKSYGDVVIFDTTYNTNRYCMIFAPIMGVNNHGQTIVFFGAFLSDETANSFIWLFTEFLKAMPGDAPKMIITDQDLAMTKVIPEALPNTFHRYCSWHILMKFSDKPGINAHYEQFRACVWDSETRDEFDLRWKDIIKDINLNEDTWLQSIFNIRSQWVPAYVNHIFSAGMSSSQRVESGHAFFKRYVSKNNSLVDFFFQFNRGLLHQRHMELMADHSDINEKAKTRCPIKMEKQMANIYTRTYFYKFQDQLWISYSYNVSHVVEDATHNIYKVIHIDDREKKRERLIIYDKSTDFASCSCHMFESLGIPCRHILAYLHKICQLHELPDQYILKRWTRLARSDPIVDNDGGEIAIDNSLIGKRSALFQRFSHVIDKVILNEEASQIFCEALDSVIERIKPLLNNVEEVSPSVRRSIAFDAIIEPDLVKAKGSGKRLKGRKEMAREKYRGRRCNGCGKYGQSHDRRNCPMLQNQSLNVDQDAFDDMENSSSSQGYS